MFHADLISKAGQSAQPLKPYGNKVAESIRQQLTLWETLSARQRQLLELIYQVDQEVRSIEKQRWLEREHIESAPFNWLLYGDIGTCQLSRLKLLTLRAGLTDTFIEKNVRTLISYELIECLGDFPHLGIRLTWQGQAAGCGDMLLASDHFQPIASLSTTFLSEATWRALAIATRLSHSGGCRDLPVESNGYCKGIHLNTWKLLAHRDPPLVTIRHSLVHTTAFGHVFYIEHYDHYRKCYPAVDAPLLGMSRADIEQKLWRSSDFPTLARLKRGNKGLGETAASIGSDITPALLYQFERGNIFNQQKIAIIQSWLKR